MYKYAINFHKHTIKDLMKIYTTNLILIKEYEDRYYNSEEPNDDLKKMISLYKHTASLSRSELHKRNQKV